jgi:5-methyltetrahydropteroyltriglutamate--homocysteine methyltransferase
MRPLPEFLPTTSVGSFPKPDDLKEARTRFAQGRISSKELREVEERATLFWIRKQEELDVDLLVDGEQYRGDMATYFAENVQGCEISGLVRSYGNRYYKKPIIMRELRRERPITVDWFRFAQGLTDRPVIGMLTGPYTMMDWSFNEFYPSRADAAFAWARILNEEARDLEGAGARFIQIDEPAVSVRPEEMDLAIETMRVAVNGLAAKTITHICYGDFDRIYPKVLEMPVDRIDLEMSNSDLDLLRRFREHPFTKELGFGVVDVHSHRLESKDLIKERIRRALDLVPPHRLYIDPDCGLKTRKVEEAIEKMRVIVESSKEIRQELSA